MCAKADEQGTRRETRFCVSGARLLVGPGRRAGRALRLRCARPTSASAPGVRTAVRAAAVVGCAAAVAPSATSSERGPEAVKHAAAPPSGAVAAVAVLVARRALAAAAAASPTTPLAASAALATTPAALFAPTRADELVQRQVQPRRRRRHLHAWSNRGRRGASECCCVAVLRFRRSKGACITKQRMPHASRA